MTLSVAAFYLLAWVFAVQHDGSTKEGAIHFKNRFSLIECNSKATELAERKPLDAMKAKGDKALYSRFVCVPVMVETRQ